MRQNQLRPIIVYHYRYRNSAPIGNVRGKRMAFVQKGALKRVCSTDDQKSTQITK